MPMCCWRSRIARNSQKPGHDGMRLLVCGGRDWRDQARMDAALDAVHRKYGVSLLIEGGQVSRDRATGELYGADWHAGTWAIRRCVPHWTCYAQWFSPTGEIDRAAGPERNRRMLTIGQPAAAVAFPGGKGTRGMVQLLRTAGVPIWQPYAPKP